MKLSVGKLYTTTSYGYPMLYDIIKDDRNRIGFISNEIYLKFDSILLYTGNTTKPDYYDIDRTYYQFLHDNRIVYASFIDILRIVQ